MSETGHISKFSCPLPGQRVDRDGAFTSRRGPGEGALARPADRPTLRKNAFQPTRPQSTSFPRSSFVFIDIPGLFRKNAVSSQLSAFSGSRKSRVEELTPQAAARPYSSIRLSTSRLLDFLTLSFFFIDIPGLFRKNAVSSQLSAVSLFRESKVESRGSRS